MEAIFRRSLPGLPSIPFVVALAAWLIAVVATAFLLAALLGGSDESTFSVEPSSARAGEAVTLSLSTEGQPESFYGRTWFQRTDPQGKWDTAFLLHTRLGDQPPGITRVPPDENMLMIGITYPVSDEEVVRLPRVPPGEYRLVKTIEDPENTGGFGSPPPAGASKFVAHITIVD